MLRHGMEIKPTISVSNSATTVLFNSTYGLNETPTHTGAGTKRGVYAGYRCVVSIKCTGQNVTLYCSELDSGDSWNIVNGSGSGQVITASATWASIDFAPESPDWEMYVTNGGTGPTTLLITVMLIPDRAKVG